MSDNMPTTGYIDCSSDEPKYLPMGGSIEDIRRDLLWDQIRTINTNMPEDMFQEMKALPIADWVQTWFDAFEGTVSKEDLTAVHGMLWPAKR